MSAAIKLTVITGPHNRVRYCFREKTECKVGRAPDCKVQFNGYEKDSLISRHHCILDIDPPRMWIRDLKSTNGTFLNGKPIFSEAMIIISNECPPVEVNHGDMLTIGGTTVEVDVIDCPSCLAPPVSPESNDELLELDGEPVKRCNGDCLHATKAEVLQDNSTVLWEV